VPDFHRIFDTLLNGPARYTFEQKMSPGMAFIVVVGAFLAELVTAYVIVWLLVKFVQYAPALASSALRLCGVGEKEKPHTFLELTFPADTTKSAYATEQLHILLRTLVTYNGLWDSPGRSFAEWTPMSTRPARSSSSTPRTKRDLSPTAASSVFTGTTSAPPSAAATASA
jgi:hypothetical protein